MSEYVIMPKADYVSACNKIREKTQKTDLIKSGDWVQIFEEVIPATFLGKIVGAKDTKYTSSLSLFTKAELETIGFSEAVSAGKRCFIWVMSIDAPPSTSAGNYIMRHAYATNFKSDPEYYARYTYGYKSGSSYKTSLGTGLTSNSCFGTSSYTYYPCYNTTYNSISWPLNSSYSGYGRYYAFCGYLDE